MGEVMKRTLAFIVVCLIGLPFASIAQNQEAPSTQNQEPDRMNVVFRANVRIEGNTSALTGGVAIRCSIRFGWNEREWTPNGWGSGKVVVQEVGPVAGPKVIPVELRIDDVPLDILTEINNYFEWYCWIQEADDTMFTAPGHPGPSWSPVGPAYAGTCDQARGTISSVTFTARGRSLCVK